MPLDRHVWEIVEIELHAKNQYENPYMTVDVWADLKGPGFSKRVYGFWDGGDVFRIRMTAVCVGKWSYITGANVSDDGLCGKKGEFEAVDWTEAEKAENACRRGIVIASENGHALQYSDGTPVYLLGDTQWAIFTDRFPWFDDDEPRDLGPGMGFKDIVRYRINQGFNFIASIACLPGWQDDGYPSQVEPEPGLFLRSGWKNPAYTPYDGIKEMRNEGGLPFEFPGKVPGYGKVYPDMERINPEYFKYVDRKINWLNENGVTVFLETMRRDCSTAMKKFHPWPQVYIRLMQYVFTRYQANNCVLSPIHYDYDQMSIPGEEYNEAINMMVEKYGKPPFGTLLSCNPHGTSLANFGKADENKWIDMHQIGNTYGREHDYFWFLTDIFHQDPPVPGLNGEPYYPGGEFGCGKDQIIVIGDSEEANIRNRSCLYGCLLSGGLAGYIYGCEGMWNANNEPESVFKMWDALKYQSGAQVQYVKDFISIIGDRYRDLTPEAELITPNKYGEPLGHKGWAYCAQLADRSEMLVYFEVGCPQCSLRGLKKYSEYEIKWFDPRNGIWSEDENVKTVQVDRTGMCKLPAKPDDRDWGLYAKLVKG